MRRLSFQTLILLAAGALSLVAQGILFSPGGTGADSIPFSSRFALGAGLFALAMTLFITTIFFQFAGRISERGTNGRLLATQACAAIAIYFLSYGLGSSQREVGFLFSSLVTLLTTLGMLSHTAPAQASRSLFRSSEGKPDLPSVRVLDPHRNIEALKGQIESLTRQLDVERHRNAQLTLLNELSQQLEAELDPPIAAQLAVNTLERAITCSVACLLIPEEDQLQFLVLASAGKASGIIPPGYRQGADSGLIGRTNKLKKTQLVNDTDLDADFIRLKDENTLSLISVPILQHGFVKGILEIGSESKYAFSSEDVAIAEGVASELMRAWERSSYRQRLTELIQAGISLTTLLDPQGVVQEIALIARKTLEARFVFVTLLDQQGDFSRISSAGAAPRLHASLKTRPANETLLRAGLNATEPFRVRDLRKYSHSRRLELDEPNLRGMLAIPIRLHRLSIGTILAFGKQEGVFFTENDESLAGLLSSQAAAAIESSWLYQELRNTLSITSLLHQLSVEVIQAEELGTAAEMIAQAARKVTNSRETGIVFRTPEGHIQAEVQIDSQGLQTRCQHPAETIDQALQTGQSIIISLESGALVCHPLLTRGRTYGAMWLNIPENRGQHFANLQTLANQAALALERSMLLSESRRQAKQLEAAYAELEVTYNRTLGALMSALDARDQDTEGHSTRVSRLACLLAEKIGLRGSQLKALQRGALLHDIGKIGIKDEILHKPGKLTEEDWDAMRVHPEIGARIVQGIPFLEDTLPVIRYHHERWDGSGYPEGLKSREIPIQARIFAVADVFDALTSRRLYRNRWSAEQAVQYIVQQAGILFDPGIVKALTNLPYHQMTEGERIIE